MNPMRILGHDLALDLGAASTQIYVRKRGIVLNEPSLVLRDESTGEVVGFGAEEPRTADSVAVCPVSRGVPTDHELTRRLIRHFLRKVHGHSFSRPRMVIALPADSTGLARDVLRDMAFEAEARQVYLVQHGLAAALGAGVQLGDPTAHMIVDLGCDTTRIAVVSRGSVVRAVTVHAGGRDVNRALIAQVRHEHHQVIGEHDAEQAKQRVGTAWKPSRARATVRGTDPETKGESVLLVTAEEVYRATRALVNTVVRAATRLIEECSPETAEDVTDHGATLTGGGALMHGLPDRLHAELGIPVQRAERPVEAVALGLGRCVDDFSLIRKDR
ncbi:rod shape-determining protein [Nonomuraea longicatena]|uniref:Rod shape-determining protein n=2 Tax=Nonomuraea longicatena TaxID=83682 RepID=A0ABN1NT96_9ACTN